MADIHVSMLFPCLNEQQSIRLCVEDAFRAIDLLGKPGEVVVVDNGSTDSSARIAREAGARVVLEPKRGYGRALMTGIKSCRGKYIHMSDADLSYACSSLPILLEPLETEGVHLVVGNRFRGLIEEGAMPKLHYHFGVPVLSALGRIFSGAKINDFHCGQRCFARLAIEGLSLSCPGMEFSSEMIIKAHCEGLLMREVPVDLRRCLAGRGSHIRRWQDGWRHLRLIGCLFPLHLLLLIALGTLSLACYLLAIVNGSHLFCVGIILLLLSTSLLQTLSILVIARKSYQLKEPSCFFLSLSRFFVSHRAALLGLLVIFCGALLIGLTTIAECLRASGQEAAGPWKQSVLFGIALVTQGVSILTLPLLSSLGPENERES